MYAWGACNTRFPRRPSSCSLPVNAKIHVADAYTMRVAGGMVLTVQLDTAAKAVGGKAVVSVAG